MSQDTRKDQRAKIVSLNVRYKSATVDEFIENHSHDVSKGGLFIKTATPFPPGTLLKFEIRIAGDKAVIAGVGRVVWKREPTQAGNERPAGMGVKFIKIDDNSRQVIDKLTGTKVDAGSAFDSEEAVTGTGTDVARAVVSAPPAIVAGSAPPRPRPSGAPPAAKTMAGMGSIPPPAKLPTETTATTPSKPPQAGAMFPTETVASDAEAPREKTVMKQAAELLEEALKEAGGSIAEVGQNPLFGAALDPRPSPPKTEAAPPVEEKQKEADPEKEPTSAGPTTLIGLAAATPRLDEAPKGPESESKASQAPMAPPKSLGTNAPDTTPLVLVDGPEAASLAAERTATTGRPAPRRPVEAVEAPPPAKKSSGGLVWAVAMIAVIGGGAFYAYKNGLFGGGDGGAPPPPQAVPTASATNATTASAAATATEAPVPSATAATAVDAAIAIVDAAAPPVTPTRPSETTPAPTPKPTATEAPVATAAPKPAATEAPAPTATEAPKPKPTATEAPTAAPTATEAPKPKPKPAPAPKPADGDNPY